MKKLFQTKLSFFIEIVLLIGLPMLLIYLFPAFVHYRLIVMSVGVIYVLFIIRLLNINLSKLGIKKRNFISSARSLALPSLLAVIITLLFNFFSPQVLATPILANEMIGYPIFLPLLVYCLVSVPVQESLFRSYLIPRLEYARCNPFITIIISAALFSSIHLAVGNTLLTIASFLLGIIWAINFLKYRNIFSIMLSHSLVGAVFIYLMRTI